MSHKPINEADWQTFRKLKPVLLDRLCNRILQECARLIADNQKSAHERYGELFELIGDRDREISVCFDDPRRTTARLMLRAIHIRGLLEPDEVAQFTEDTQVYLKEALADLDAT